MQTTHRPDTAEQPGQRRDVRSRALIITLVATIALGGLLALPAQRGDRQPAETLAFADVLPLKARAHADDAATLKEVRMRFEQGVAMLQMQQYEYALTAFHQVLALAPQLPEAHVNMGFALVGLAQWKQARDFFDSAINLRRDQVNAYYGLAISLDALGDRPGALGAMQTYLHRAPADDPFRARAESALWEWRTEQRDSARTEAGH